MPIEGRRRRKPLPRIYDGYVVSESVRAESKRRLEKDVKEIGPIFAKRRKIGPKEIKAPPPSRALELRRLAALQGPPPVDDPTDLALTAPFSNALVPSRTVVKRRGIITQDEERVMPNALKRRKIAPKQIKAPPRSRAIELRRLPALPAPPADNSTDLALSAPFSNALVPSRTVVKRRGIITQDEERVMPIAIKRRKINPREPKRRPASMLAIEGPSQPSTSNSVSLSYRWAPFNPLDMNLAVDRDIRNLRNALPRTAIKRKRNQRPIPIEDFNPKRLKFD
jgi:hypothetical protein